MSSDVIVASGSSGPDEMPSIVTQELLLDGLNSFVDGVVLIGSTQRITFWNEAMASMANIPAKNAVGATLQELFPDQADGRLIVAINWALKNGLPSVLSSSLNRRPLPLLVDGRQIKQSIYVTPLSNPSGESGCLVCFRDVTALVEKDMLLRARAQDLQDSLAAVAQARDAAESASRAKSAFLANMSHELRTPLHAILGFSDVLRRDASLSEQQQETLSIIHKSGNHLLGLINDVLEIAKIEAGKVQLHLAPFDLATLILDVAEMLRIRAEEKGLELCIDEASHYPRFILGDAAKIREILINLLSNAIKATDQGRVTLRIGVAHKRQERLIIEVEDTGCGISPEDQSRIVEPFVQIENQKKQQGTGLGLAITRQFVELMGGCLSLVSTPGQGSIFKVELEVEEAFAEDLPRIKPVRGEVVRLEPGQGAYRVLVVEDQPENRWLLITLLESAGFQVRSAENGSEAVAQFQTWNPHFIWMDWRLPEMDGIEATRRIRALEGGRQVKIAVVTASIFKESDQQLATAGFDDIVHKPFYPEKIFDCMEKLLGVRYERSATVADERATHAGVSQAALSRLPGDLREDLTRALSMLDQDAIVKTVAGIGELDAELGAALRERTRRYDYQTILTALEEIPGRDGQD